MSAYAPGSVEDLSIPGTNEFRRIFLNPRIFILDILGVIELGVTLSPVTNSNDSDSTTVNITSRQGADAAKATGAKVYSVGCGFWEVGSFGPMDRTSKNLLAEGASDRAGNLAQIRAFMLVLVVS
jgi:hypothetical protein